jgi:hypothetical protein
MKSFTCKLFRIGRQSRLVPYAVILVCNSFTFACSQAKSSAPQKPFPIGDYQYISYDDKGDKVVQGRISITSSEVIRIGSEQKTQLKGNWELKKIGRQEHIGMQEGKGDLIGMLDNSEINIDLNPGMSDANVVLKGKADGKGFHGTWSFNGYAGSLAKGKFEAIKQEKAEAFKE